MTEQDKKLVEGYLARAATLEGERSVLNGHLQEIADLILPRRALFHSERVQGAKLNSKIYDSTPARANDLLAAGLHGMLTNPAAKWFTLKIPGVELDEAQAGWLVAVEKVLFDAINDPDAAFSSAIHEMYLEFGAFGTGLMFIGESKERDGVYFRSMPLSECHIAEDGFSKIDTVFRRFTMTVAAIVGRWGLDAVSEDVMKKYEAQELDHRIELLHVVQPRRTGALVSSLAPNAQKAFTSDYVEVEASHMLASSGFDTFPYVTPRFYLAPGETYGRGPGMTALPDIKMLMEMMKTLIVAAQKAVNPPIMAPDDGFIGPLRMIPGGMNYYRSGTQDRIEPIQLGSNIPVTLELVHAIQEQIGLTFFTDQLQLSKKLNMTATEVLQETEQKLRLMGPIFGRLQSEALDRIIQRVFTIKDAQGEIPEAPEGIESFDIEYVSPMAKAQRQLESQGLIRTFEILSPFAGLDPEMFDKFDTDAMPFYIGHELFGVNPKLFRDDETVDEMRQQRREQEEITQGVQNLQTAGSAAQQFAQAGATVGGNV